MLTQEEKEVVLSIVTRLCKDETNYINSEFASGNKLYIDGCISYLSAKEKAIVKKWMVENNIIDFNERVDADDWTKRVN